MYSALFSGRPIHFQLDYAPGQGDTPQHIFIE